MSKKISVFAAGFLLVLQPAVEVLAQSTNVRPRNTNQSARYKSGIFKGSANLIRSNSVASFIGGGQSNIVGLAATNAVIGGGFGNLALSNLSTVAGGLNNAAGLWAAVGGGLLNKATFDAGVVGGGYSNSAGVGGTVGGGRANAAAGFIATVSGGSFNTNQGDFSFIGGGESNRIATGLSNATVGGGQQNTASASFATVSGGESNSVAGSGATIGGGAFNQANAARAAVGGGFANKALGVFATIPGGNNNTATNNSFAAGEYAFAEHEGSFVWGSSVGILVNATRSFGGNTFTVRAPGGARFYTAGSGTNAGVVLTNLATAWASLSDSNSKTDFAPVKPREILSKLAAMPVTSWHYKHDLHRRYIGPMAQDFRAAFGLGSDDKTISTLDSDGVMYAAIQGLVEELKERDKKIEDIKKKSAEVDVLKKKLEMLEEHLGLLPPAP